MYDVGFGVLGFLQAMQEFYPWFTNMITTLQALIMLGILAHAYTTQNIATIDVPGSNQYSVCDPSDCPSDFNGEIQSNFTFANDVNWAFGPKTQCVFCGML